jgi:hypothetical protein
MSDETSFGFFKKNIRNWLIKECMESSTNPQHFWWALEEVFEELQDEISDNPDFWDEQEFPS